MKPVFLDYHATTPCLPQVVDAMVPWFSERFGNAGSKSHAWGSMASAGVERAREQIAALIGAQPDELVLCSGATEADNLAVLGVARATVGRGRHIVVSGIEHKAVLDPARHLEANGWSLTVLDPGPSGVLSPQAVADALRPDTTLVSVMLANNEVGTLQPIQEISAVCRARGVLLHTDAAQAVGRVPVDVRALGVDLLSLTAHKLYGPKGIGALWIRRGQPIVPVEPLLFGGGQERGLRSGTLSVPLIVGLGEACVWAGRDIEAGEPARLLALRTRLWDGVCDLPGVQLNGDWAARLPGNLHCSFLGRRAADLLAALRQDVALSTGSACSSGNAKPSHVMTSLGHDADRARAALRFGLGRSTTEAEIDVVIAAVRRAVAA